jgi:hypothetical protein
VAATRRARVDSSEHGCTLNAVGAEVIMTAVDRTLLAAVVGTTLLSVTRIIGAIMVLRPTSGRAIAPGRGRLRPRAAKEALILPRNSDVSQAQQPGDGNSLYPD